MPIWRIIQLWWHFKVFYFLGRSFQLKPFYFNLIVPKWQKTFNFFSAYCSTWLLHIEVVHELVDAVFPVKDVDPGDGDVQHLRHQLVALLLVVIRAAVAPPAVSLWFLTRTNLGLTLDHSLFTLFIPNQISKTDSYWCKFSHTDYLTSWNF